jgi:DNA polymerase II small subunit
MTDKTTTPSIREESDFNEKLKKAMEKVTSIGFQMDIEAFKFLQAQKGKLDPEIVVDFILKKIGELSQPSPVVGKYLIEEAVNTLVIQEKKQKTIGVDAVKVPFQPYAKEIDSQIEIVKDASVENSACGDIDSFLNYFRDRFQQLRKILRQRLDVKDATTVGSALDAGKGKKVKFVGMIADRAERRERFILTVDDLEETATVMIQPSNPQLLEKARTLLLDQVICIVGVRGASNLIIADDILLPDIPYHKTAHSEEPINVVLTSDLHIGSNKFERALFERFILWINGKLGGMRERERAGRVKYVVIAGDLVDGIGVYPDQENELEVKNIYKQYELAASLLEKIPDYIQIILIPGNHDASRKALPQAPIPRKYAEPIYRLQNVTSLGNPSQVKLHGVEILIHHGRSLENLFATIPGVEYRIPAKAMTYLLKARHLAPVYGERTPIVPSLRDKLVIDSVPDIYHAGHVHILDHTQYRGTLIINSGCWQGQTSYQKKMGLEPTPGIVPVVDLQKMSLTLENFSTV